MQTRPVFRFQREEQAVRKDRRVVCPAVDQPTRGSADNAKPVPLTLRLTNTTRDGPRGAAAPSASQAASSPASPDLNRPPRTGRDQIGPHGRRSALRWMAKLAPPLTMEGRCRRSGRSLPFTRRGHCGDTRCGEPTELPRVEASTEKASRASSVGVRCAHTRPGI